MGTHAFNKKRPKPDWLVKPPKEGTTGIGHKYYNKLWNAQPVWADVKAIRVVYSVCKAMRKAGAEVEVDHIYPLIHPNFCGLHVSWNLRIISRERNLIKSNNDYPDHPQRDIFERIHANDFFELIP